MAPDDDRHDDDRADALFASLEAATEAEDRGAGRLRAWSTRARMSLWLVLAAAPVTVVLVLKGTRGLTRPASALAAGALAVVAIVAMRRGLQPLQRGLLPFDGPAAFVGMAVFALVAMVLPSEARDTTVQLAPCLVLSSLVAVPPFVAAVLLDRDPPRGIAFGALAAGLVGVAASQAICPAFGLGHVLMNHVLPLGLVTALLALLGRASVSLVSRRRED